MKKKISILIQTLLMVTAILGIVLLVNTCQSLSAKAAVIEQPMPINEVFLDTNLANVMKTKLKKPSVTSDVSQTELDAVSKLTAENKNIKSLEGVQYLNNLKTLWASGNQITSINQLNGLMKLSDLDLSANQVSNINAVSNLVNLSVLYLNDNNVTNLNPVANLSKLTELEMSNNKLSNIRAISDLTNLNELILSGNTISTINAIKDLTNLDYLELDNNQISDLSALASLTELSGLSVNDNNISNIRAISGLKKIDHLFMARNQIVDISAISNTLNLEVLQLEGNDIKDVTPIANLIKLNFLGLKDNQISDISPLSAVFNSTNISGVSLDNQYIISEPIIYQKGLKAPNSVKDLNGLLIAPNTISNGGVYISPNINWDLPDYTKQVSYTFNQPISFGMYPGTFSGTVIQSLHNAFTATFDVDGVTTSEVIEEASILQEPTEPTKEGYTFTGWYDTKTDGNKWDFATDKMPPNDITLYAQFSINNYIVTFDVDGKTTDQKTDYQALLKEPNTPTKEGYTFVGWYDTKSGGTKWNFAIDEMPKKDITLYAKFTKNGESSNSKPGPHNPVGFKNETSNSNGSNDNKTNMKLPQTGDNNYMFSIAVGILLLAIIFLELRKKHKF
ncbi:LPXTG cell wall anchor domain-containing protein [Listeria monocytogenes]|nr:LPXTG cell wall anchor domain-containing protein [Listeria monocytogenes]EAC9721694.1 LPXTG cell wall anchor domain-containing protein [Listeria monocytogenes]EAC9864682.1 LPXTG cell wall anchor domain-containing protein [Listeria monocytogenes]EAD0296411.1 LPXTG cell wall anchor domain-containing protein [Listeria monocytogenes]EAD0385827.1 LPXTG cell wall anchor domain-containing protein [Listeria monocytogenes]